MNEEKTDGTVKAVAKNTLKPHALRRGGCQRSGGGEHPRRDAQFVLRRAPCHDSHAFHSTGSESGWSCCSRLQKCRFARRPGSCTSHSTTEVNSSPQTCYCAQPEANRAAASVHMCSLNNSRCNCSPLLGHNCAFKIDKDREDENHRSRIRTGVQLGKAPPSFSSWRSQSCTGSR